MLPLAIAGCFAVAAFYLYRWILRDRLEVVRIQLLIQKKRYAAALPILRRRLENLQRTKGEDHLDTAVAKFSMGQIEYQHGRRDVGKGLVDQATAIFEAYRGPEERDFVVHLNNLGIAQSKTDSPDLAIRTYERCLAVERRLMAHGAGDQDQVARTLGNLGVALKRAGRVQDSIPLYQESLELRTRLHGAESADVGRININLCESYIALERWTEAERRILDALRILEKHRSVDVAEAYDTYAKLCELREDWNKAEELRFKSLTAFEHSAGPDSVKFAEEMEKLARVLERLNRNTECQSYQDKAAAVRKALA